jgi:predicted nucleic acid-binding protein
MPKTKYTYCDSCVFIAYFNNEAERVNVIHQLFEETQQNPERKILTSALTIAEVAHVENEKPRNGGKARLKEDAEEILDEFWHDTTLLQMIDFEEVLARKARALMRQATKFGYSLKTMDAIHLVSAQVITIDEFYTYDKGLFKFSTITGYKICEPYNTQPRLL